MANMWTLTGEEITALADTIDTAATDERSYIFGVGGISDYSDDEWPEVAEIKATRWELCSRLLNKMGQTDTADKCEELAKDLRVASDPPCPSRKEPECECGRELRFCTTSNGAETHGDL